MATEIDGCSCAHYRQIIEELQGELSTLKAVIIARMASSAAVLEFIDTETVNTTLHETA